MPAVMQKSGTMSVMQKSGTMISKKGSMVVDETAETVTIALVSAPPDKRPAEAMKLRVMLSEPGGVFLVWDQLCRTRKNFGSQAGLIALVEMLNAKADKYQTAGHEPAVQCLATFCNTKEYVMVIGKIKKIFNGLMNILSEPTASFKAKESASWVLRRATEFCKQARAELGSDRDALQVLSRILRGGDDGDARSRLGSPEEGARRVSEDNLSVNTHSYQASPVPSRPVSRPGSREPSRPPSRETSFELPANNAGSRPVSGVAENRPPAKGGLDGASARKMYKEASVTLDASAVKDQSMSRSGPLPGLNKALMNHNALSQSGPVTLEKGPTTPSKGLLKEPSMPRPGPGPSSTKGLLPPPLTEETLSRSFKITVNGSWETGEGPKLHPFAAPGLGISRPGTTFANGTQVITFTSEPDQMCIEGNLCAALGNAAHSDEVLERLGKTEGIVLGVVNLLQFGSDWAKGHAGRTLGNLAYSPENCKFMTQCDRENNAVHSLCALLASDASQRSKEWALHAVANLSRNANLCASFNRIEGLLQLLQHLTLQGVEREDVDRAIANLSQARLGTRTWRLPRKI
mmetsp:Transcript_63480/g.149433  ORF Transcript_63480/g.149433 Transcript_63480/m.149433 type:complete len:575 (+) Transcript_63480:160-1884(+)